LDDATIKERNDTVEQTLASLGLQSVDVMGDGNCQFRAMSVGVYGDESHHSELRMRTASHMALNYQSLFKTSDTSLNDTEKVNMSVNRIKRDKEEVGQETILTAADLLQRQLHIYRFVTPPGTTPEIYSPINKPVYPPIALAFYEPGHYRAVKSIAVLN
jgi:hypothetical protein